MAAPAVVGRDAEDQKMRNGFNAMIGLIATIFALALSALLAYCLFETFIDKQAVLAQSGIALPAHFATLFILIFWIEAQRMQAHWRGHFVLYAIADQVFSVIFWLGSILFAIYVVNTSKQDWVGLLLLGAVIFATTCDLLFNGLRRLGGSGATLQENFALLSKKLEQAGGKYNVLVTFIAQEPGVDEYRVHVDAPRDASRGH